MNYYANNDVVMWREGWSALKGAPNLVKGIRGHLPEEVISLETEELLGEGLLSNKELVSSLSMGNKSPQKHSGLQQ